MKKPRILFVCRGNVGRSQIAAALFKKTTGIEADSAGTKTKEGIKIKKISLTEPVIRFMKKENMDISRNITTQLKPKMLDNYDKIIVMAEPETIPDYLNKNDKVIYWKIEDLEGRSDEEYKKRILKIKSLIRKLIKKLRLAK